MPVKGIQIAAVMLLAWGMTCREEQSSLAPPIPEGAGDVALYRAIATRVSQGEEYYLVAGEELHSRRYATIPSFNWRLPTLAMFLAHVPSEKFAAVALLVLGIAMAATWGIYLIRSGHDLLCLAAAPMLLVMAPAWGGTSIYFHEVWAGLLLALSLGFSLLGLVVPSVLFGAAALAVRELAMPYVVMMAVLAWYDRRRGEMWAWLTVIGLFGAGLAWHLSLARSFIPADAIANAWVVTGGWCHVLKTARTNLALYYLPTPVVAAAVPICWAGLWAWRGRGTHRLAVVVTGYFAAFAIAGRPDNFYWGLMTSQVLLLGLVGWAIALSRGGGR